MSESATNAVQVMSPAQVRRTLKRLAYEIIEHNRGGDSLSIIGIRTRGTALAHMLAEQLSTIEGHPYEVSELRVAAYRDDLDLVRPDESAIGEAMVDEKDVILVDDVLFTGRTARAALDALVHAGRPRSVQLVILIDRGHREFPIQPTYVGRVIPTKHRERVVVEVDGGVTVTVEE